MSRASRLAQAAQAAFDGDPWYGPSLDSVLDEMPPRRIHERPVAGAHSIAELMAHIAHWKDVVRRRLEGDPAPDANQADWPEIPSSASFDELRRRIDEAHARLVARVSGLDDSALDAEVAGNRISREEIVHGIVQHDIYHAGQLTLLARALTGA